MAEPIGRGMARVGLTPNALTLIGFGIAVLAAVAAGAQAWLVAGLLTIFGGIFDMFDGLVARATGKASKAGAFMDSTFDRWGEAVVYVGIVWGCVAAGFDQGAVLAAAAMACRVHGQLHPRSRREPRLRARQGHGQRRLRAARGAARHPHRRALVIGLGLVGLSRDRSRRGAPTAATRAA